MVAAYRSYTKHYTKFNFGKNWQFENSGSFPTWINQKNKFSIFPILNPNYGGKS
jgi:hypothetical protein